jgi:hypothetical protein
MTEANKNTLKDLAKILGGMGALIAMIYLFPQGSVAQKILAFVMVGALVLGIVWFTPLGNPIKRIIRSIKEKK